MAHGRTMSSRVSRLFQKWPCFGGKTVQEEVEHDSLRQNQPKIIITECKSVESSPNISRNNSSSCSSPVSYDEKETEIKIKSNGTPHEMGMSLTLKTRECSEDKVDGKGGNEEVASMIYVNEVKLGSFAHGFGVRKGDMITKINDKICDRVQEIQKTFLHKSSDELVMEILRKTINQNTGGTELVKMVISNATRIGGITENELEIIQVEMGSNWSLSDNEKYFHQDLEVDVVYLQFGSSDYPFVVRDGNQLALSYHLPESEEWNAKFLIHEYWSMSTLSRDTGKTVVLQHADSSLCVALDHESIHLEGVDNLTTIEGKRPFLFNMHSELSEGSGMNQTFQSLLDRSRYIGFNLHGRKTELIYAEPILVSPQQRDPLGNEHDEVVFVVTNVNEIHG